MSFRYVGINVNQTKGGIVIDQTRGLMHNDHLNGQEKANSY